MEPTKPKEGTPEPPVRATDSTFIPPDRSALSSEPFEIIAGSGKRYFVHRDILTAKSKPLRSAATGVWKEATEKKIDLSDWDGDTVGCFVEYLYSGGYQVSELVRSYGKEVGGIEVEKGEKGGGSSATNTPGPVRTQGDLEEYMELALHSAALVAHAKVYALAQYKDIEELKMMAFGRLKTVLEGLSRAFQKNEDSIERVITPKVIDLLTYVYSHIDSPENSGEPMPELVSTFVARNLEFLTCRGDMSALLREGGECGVELILRVGDRLYNDGLEMQKLKNRVAELEKVAKPDSRDGKKSIRKPPK